MSLEQRALALAQSVGSDIGTLVANIGNLTLLNTTNKSDVVSAINELLASLSSIDVTSLISDTENSAVVAWSANKITASLLALKTEIINDAPEQYNTLQEIAAYLAANTTEVESILTAIGNRVRYDAVQSLTIPQQVQACTNIGIGNIEELYRNIYLIARDTNTYIQPGYVEPGYVG